jgi:hypothetical protein
MSGIAFFIVLATLASVAIVVAGGISMAKGGNYDRVHAFPLMEAEVIVQALVVGMVIIAGLFWV